MNKQVYIMLAGALAFGLAGCRSVDTRASGYQTQTASGISVTASPGAVATQQPVQVLGVGARQPAVNVSPAPAPVAPAPVAPAPAAPAAVAAAPAVSTQIATASAVLEQPRVLVQWRKTNNPDATQVATLLGNGLQGALAAARYRVVYAGPSEIIATLNVTCQPLNVRGTREVYKGDADVEVTRAPELNAISGQVMTDIVARNRFDVQGAPGRGSSDAMKSVADKMSAVVSPWVADACLKVGGKMEVCIVTISNAWFLSPHSDYPTRFCARVRALGGVYDCTILSTDNVNKTVQARVVYDRDRFPDGLINRLYTIPELNIHR